MKKFIVLLLACFLVLSPTFCSGKREVGLKTILLGSQKATKLSEEKHDGLLTRVRNSQKSSTKSSNSQENLSNESDIEIVNKIVATAHEAGAINQATLHSLAIIQSTANRQADEIKEASIYIGGLEVDLDDQKAQTQSLEVMVATKKGDIETLKQKLKNRKSFKFALVGANYNLDDGYGISFDTGVKFDTGLITSVGVSFPIDNINPAGALDVRNYTFNTKIGWAW